MQQLVDHVARCVNISEMWWPAFHFLTISHFHLNHEHVSPILKELHSTFQFIRQWQRFHSRNPKHQSKCVYKCLRRPQVFPVLPFWTSLNIRLQVELRLSGRWCMAHETVWLRWIPTQIKSDLHHFGLQYSSRPPAASRYALLISSPYFDLSLFPTGIISL